MEGIFMQQIEKLVRQLATDFPALTFTQNDTSYWSPSQATVFYSPAEPCAEWVLLHELSHALLEHTAYNKDVELLAKERDAWHYACTVLAPRYSLMIDQDFIEDHLDTYRDWLHAKSSCPTCNLTGIEQSKGSYICIACHTSWQVNEARTCHVRRTAIHK